VVETTESFWGFDFNAVRFTPEFISLRMNAAIVGIAHVAESQWYFGLVMVVRANVFLTFTELLDDSEHNSLLGELLWR
jgi:hypothetical protein